MHAVSFSETTTANHVMAASIEIHVSLLTMSVQAY